MCPAIFSTLDWIVHFLVLPFPLSAYASVVVSRLYRFYDSKRDAWETIISMEDKLSRVDCPTLSHPWASACLNHPTQQLRYAGLLQADQAVDAIHTAIEQSLQGAQKKSLREKQMSKFLAQNGKSGLSQSAHHFAQFFSRGR